MNTFQNYYHKHNHNFYIQQLTPDPESEANYPNKITRSVGSGHYVLSEATPITDPQMITYNSDLAKELKLSEQMIESDDLLRYLSGHNGLKNPLNEHEEKIDQWVTPYALSIYGQPIIHNGPFKTDLFYGDGRAHSIGEFVVNGHRYELQLKGSGTTPFSRFGDGRAVLRSSVREYLASEAMHRLRVPTTRTLSLIVSETEKTERSWYKMSDENTKNQKCSIKQSNIKQSNGSKTCRGDVTTNLTELNPVAITCRVSESFFRVGHFELFGIRANNSIDKSDQKQRLDELEQLFRHMTSREYDENNELLRMPIDKAIPVVCNKFAARICNMIAQWIRVGYVQSNFNSDNCLVSGKTMDYGPFGFMEKYDPEKNFWTGSGFNFSFMNQMNAGKKNFIQFIESLKPLLKNHNSLDLIIDTFDRTAEFAMNQMWAKKSGLIKIDWKNDVEQFFKKMINLMKISDFDYTIFWRQLCDCALFVDNKQRVYDHMSVGFYSKVTDDWKHIFDQYIELLKKEHDIGKRSYQIISQMMKYENPKYVPREWMLVKAYTDAQIGSFDQLLELQELFKNPYDEQETMEHKYYKLTPLDLVENKPGYSQMSCSS